MPSHATARLYGLLSARHEGAGLAATMEERRTGEEVRVHELSGAEVMRSAACEPVELVEAALSVPLLAAGQLQEWSAARKD